MGPSNGAAGSRKTTALPDVQLVSIDHPCIVKDSQVAFKSLGGEQQVKHILDPSDDDGRSRKTQRTELRGPNVGVSLNPHDPLDKKLESTPTAINGVLMKVTLPRWTGRKRRRGTNDPFEPAPTDRTGHRVTAPDLIRRLQDNVHEYTIEAVGRVDTTHRFNTLPDLRIREDDVPIMRELKRHASKPDYDLLRQFHVSLQPGTAGITALPRPDHFIPPGVNNDDPFDLVYNQGRNRLDTGYSLKYAPGAEMPSQISSLVKAIAAFLEKRPISTRLVLQNAFPKTSFSRLDAAATWVSYKSKGGPWRDCIVKRGVDPSSDPEYRKYQIVAARPKSTEKKEDTADVSNTHIFDGVTKLKARTYQFCDIMDPALASVVNTADYRRKEEGTGGSLCGWYHNGSAAKIRVLMADKLRRLHTPGVQLLNEQAYAALAALPERVDEGTKCEVDGRVYGEDARLLGMAVRQEALELNKREDFLRGGADGEDGGDNEDEQRGGEGQEDGEDEGMREQEDYAVDEEDGHAVAERDAMAIDPDLLNP